MWKSVPFLLCIFDSFSTFDTIEESLFQIAAGLSGGRTDGTWFCAFLSVSGAGHDVGVVAGIVS